jgi:hypothetical protein
MATIANLSSSEKTNEAFAFLKKSLPTQLQAPQVAIVCGSGLGGLANTIDSELRVEIDYADIPHFPRLTVAGHAGKLVFGLLDKQVPAVLMVGRAHYYEGHSIDQVTFPIRVFKLLGVDTVICELHLIIRIANCELVNSKTNEDTYDSNKCRWRSQPRLCGRRHCTSKRRMSTPIPADTRLL